MGEEGLSCEKYEAACASGASGSVEEWEDACEGCERGAGFC